MHWKDSVRWLIDSIARPLNADMAEAIHVRQVDIASDPAGSREGLTFRFAFEHAPPMKGHVAALDV